jgi:glyoxylase-like metal-dependent hydrolase (beta-lactamase superfamily II)
MPLPLEDSFSDILNKARRGLGAPSGIPESLFQGTWHEPTAREAARALHLSFPALQAIALGTWQPQPQPLPPGCALFTTPFGDMTVNAYLVWDPSTRLAAAFDTGGDATPLLEHLKKSHLTLKTLYLTHTHGDHVFDVDRVVEHTGAHVLASAREPFPGATLFEPGTTFDLGPLRIESLPTPGHSPGGTSYAIHGLDRPIVIVGDALFAGSMGGPNTSYTDGLHGARTHILNRQTNTLVAPGHGPLTTVGEENQHNPFFA